ncbi:hypothetical protein PGB90_008876 [Kerria lacca]
MPTSISVEHYFRSENRPTIRVLPRHCVTFVGDRWRTAQDSQGDVDANTASHGYTMRANSRALIA